MAEHEKPADVGAQPTKARSLSGEPPSDTALIGLYGLGKLLATVQQESLQKDFQEALRGADLLIELNAHTARAIEDFISKNVKGGPEILSVRNHDNCDPRTDPWCINFLISPT